MPVHDATVMAGGDSAEEIVFGVDNALEQAGVFGMQVRHCIDSVLHAIDIRQGGNDLVSHWSSMAGPGRATVR